MTDALDCIDTFLQSRRPIAYYSDIGVKLKSEPAGIFLCQFVYWRKKGSDPNGWIYKSAAEIQKETGLTYEKQLTARKKLRELGLIEERYRRMEHQFEYRVSLTAFQNTFQVVAAVPVGESPSGDMGNAYVASTGTPSYPLGNHQEAVGDSLGGTWAKPKSYKEAEITTETTTEITFINTPPTPSSPPAVAECAAEVIEAELISEPETALATIPEKPFLLRRSTKRELQPFQQPWFEEFWAYYPRKDDRKEAKEAFAKHVINQEIFDRTMEALNNQLPEMLENVKRYRKMGATWLNTEPWDNPGEASPPARTPDPSRVDRFALARLTRKERASIEFTKRVMREYGSTQCR